jgi:hypothetical protein
MTAELDYRDTASARNPAIASLALDIITSAAATFRDQFLAALHESRRKQAAIELARHRHLIYDPETAIYFRIGAHPE